MIAGRDKFHVFEQQRLEFMLLCVWVCVCWREIEKEREKKEEFCLCSSSFYQRKNRSTMDGVKTETPIERPQHSPVSFLKKNHFQTKKSSKTVQFQ